MATSLTKFFIDAVLKVDMLNTVQGKGMPVKGVGLAKSIGPLFTDGTTANKADNFVFEVDQAITSGNNVDLDMYDLAGFDAATDIYGNSVTFAEIVALYVFNHTDSAGNLIVGGNGTTAAWNSPFGADDNAAITLHPGGVLLMVAPDDPAWAVADTTNHLLRLAASGGNTTHDIAVLGRSA